MGNRLKVLFVILAVFTVNCAQQEAEVVKSDLAFEGEEYFGNITQLTFAGENAEAYFSNDNSKIIYQSKSGDLEADQIFTMNLDGSDQKMVSTGKGATTCAYYIGDDMSRIVYASTHGGGDKAPMKISLANGKYVWSLFETYDIYTANADGSDIVQITNTPGYDAEATVSRDGKSIVFTSVRDGDLDIYTMDVDGSNVKRLTDKVGYDGGPFFSWDGTKIIYRAHHPEEEAAKKEFKDYLNQGLVQPTRVDIYIMDADGSNQTQITDNGKANFAPFLLPDDQRIVFASNLASESGRDFEIFIMDLDGSNMKQITHNPTFDSFPMFTKDGTKMIFASNRNAAKEGETNVFIADFIDKK